MLGRVEERRLEAQMRLMWLQLRMAASPEDLRNPGGQLLLPSGKPGRMVTYLDCVLSQIEAVHMRIVLECLIG